MDDMEAISGRPYPTAMDTTLMWWRQLNSKAKLESRSSQFSFKRSVSGTFTVGFTARVNQHRPTLMFVSTSSRRSARPHQ